MNNSINTGNGTQNHFVEAALGEKGLKDYVNLVDGEREFQVADTNGDKYLSRKEVQNAENSTTAVRNMLNNFDEIKFAPNEEYDWYLVL